MYFHVEHQSDVVPESDKSWMGGGGREPNRQPPVALRILRSQPGFYTLV